ncbi:unnamed protein product, partial [Heterosigma akashiwo]
KEKTVVILYHKPKHVITSHSSGDASSESPRKTVYEDIMTMKGYTGFSAGDSGATKTQQSFFAEVTGIRSKLHAIGRLDADTTGLLLLTNDGQLVHHVTNPTAASSQQNKLVKVYDALIMGHHTLYEETCKNGGGNRKSDGNNNPTCTSASSSRQLRKLLSGVDIGEKYGGMTQPPHSLEVLGHPSPKSTLVRISISEGKNRQVRRMFHAINSGVIRLHRRKVGNVSLEMMQQDKEFEGKWRLLTDKEIFDGLGWKVRQLESS